MTAKTWTLRAPKEALDARTTPLSPMQRFAFMALDEMARMKPYCWPSNDELGRRLGRTESTIQRVVQKLEDLGFIARIMTVRGRPERVGILMLRRINSASPACRTDAEKAAAAAELATRWAKATNSRGPIKTTISGPSGASEAARPDPKPADSVSTPKTPGNAARQHPKNGVSGTPKMGCPAPQKWGENKEEGKYEDSEKQQQAPLLQVEPEEKRPRHLTDGQAEAMVKIRSKVEKSAHSFRTEAILKVAREAMLDGHDPGRVAGVIAEAIRPNITNPAGWARSAIRQRAEDEDSGTLQGPKRKAKPEPQVAVPIQPEKARPEVQRTYGNGLWGKRPKASMSAYGPPAGMVAL